MCLTVLPAYMPTCIPGALRGQRECQIPLDLSYKLL